MGALLDSLTEGGYGDTDNQVQTLSGSASTGGATFTGILQQLAATGTGYLSNRLDVDIANRLYGNQAMPRLNSTQNPQNQYGNVVRTPNGGSVAQINLNAVLPLVLVGGLVFFFARRRG